MYFGSGLPLSTPVRNPMQAAEHPVPSRFLRRRLRCCQPQQTLFSVASAFPPSLREAGRSRVLHFWPLLPELGMFVDSYRSTNSIQQMELVSGHEFHSRR